MTKREDRWFRLTAFAVRLEGEDGWIVDEAPFSFPEIEARIRGNGHEIAEKGLCPRLRRLRNVVTGRLGQDRTYSEHPALKVRHDRLSALAHRVSARLPG